MFGSSKSVKKTDSSDDQDKGAFSTMSDTGVETDEGGDEFDKIPGKSAGKTSDNDSGDYMEETRTAVKRFMSTSFFGKVYENIFILLSCFSCGEYIYSTYPEYIASDIISILSDVELCLAVLFMWDWCLCFFIADSKLNHLTSFYAMIDLMTVIPIWVTREYPCMNVDQVSTAKDQVIYFLCGVTTTRILRALRIRRKLNRIEDEVSRCISEIALDIVCSVLFFAALVQFLESQDISKREFHTWLYYIIVTISSVGYGDIYPVSMLGRIAIMVIIAGGFILGPQMSSDLVEKIGRQSIYARAKYTPLNRATHVYICGNIETTSLLDFFNEMFHEDHGDENVHAVVMAPTLPSVDMLNILRDPVFALRVTYLEGSALSERDLQRAQVREAEAIFIMCDKFTPKVDQEDSKTVLMHTFLKKYVMRKHSLEKPLFAMQLIRPENRRHLVDSSSIEGEENSKEDIILCLNEIKMGILAKAVMFPGSNTLLMNLLSSFADDNDDDEEEEDKATKDEREASGIEHLNEDANENWVGEYQRGCGWEIYSTSLSPIFTGTQFAMLSDILYQRIGIVLFGLEVQDLSKEKAHARMFLNPADYTFPDQEHYRIEAFVIAENKNTSDLSFEEQEDAESSGRSKFSHDDTNSALEMAQRATAAGALYSQHVPSHKPISHTSLSKKQEEKKEHAWQTLLRKNENKDELLGSEQKLGKLIEEEYVRTNFFTLPHIAPLEDCTILTSVELEAPFLCDHTLIVGKNLENIFDLISPLRAAYLGYIRPIVILTPNPISEALWTRIGAFPGLFVLYGSMLEELDVIRAGIFKAKQCIVLANDAERVSSGLITAGAKATKAALADADAVFSYQQIIKTNPGLSTCIEIVNASNVGFLDPKEGMVSGEVDYKFTPQFASGALLVSSLLDTLICQAFYNRSIVSVIRLFVSGVEARDRETIRLLLLHKEVTEKKGVAAIVGSSLYQMNVPETDVRTYGELYKALARDGIIPVGLYRGVFKNLSVGPKQNKTPYVFTNPPKETEVFSCDKVFVLSQKPILGKSNIIKRNNWSLLRTTTNTDPLERVRIEYTDKKEKAVDRLSKIDEKFDGILSALKQVTGRQMFEFETRKEEEEVENYKQVHARVLDE